MTIFEKIAAREIPAKIVDETKDWIAFWDIDPKAPVHVLIVPKKVIPRIGLAEEDDEVLLGKLMLAAGRIAEKLNVKESGFRLIVNHGPDAGEAVPHLHVHFLAGRPFGWPPG